VTNIPCMTNLHLATFQTDITPPLGHPLCGGWVPPAKAVCDPLYALGVVLLGQGAPVVLCAVDWCEISNASYTLWQQRLAAAVGTVPERVAVHCVHQHDAPWPDEDLLQIARQAGDLPDPMDGPWCRAALERVAETARAACALARPLTHVEIGQARVHQIASNRRLLGPDGKVRAVRYTSCADPQLRAEPEGLIDPMLKTLSFWHEDTRLAALHYYAVHPCSYYGDGCVTADFVGHARQRRAAEDPGVLHVYFTGCAGNIGAGKYNDGAPQNRPLLAERLYQALAGSEQRTQRCEIDRLEWRTQGVVFPPDLRCSQAQCQDILLDRTQRQVDRYRAALRLVSIQRVQAGLPITLTSLFLTDRICLLHLPGEAFVEYQLFAQQQRPDCFVAVASYGDCATGYIPLAKSYEEGGYEPTDAYVAAGSEGLLREAITWLVQA
jgi:hypothetical protein